MKRAPKVGDYVRTTKAVGPFDKGTLLRIYEIERPVVSGSIIYHAVCGKGPRWKPPIGTTCVMFDDDFELEEGNVEEGPKPNPFPSTKGDIEERVREIHKQKEELTCELSELADKLIWMEEYGYGKYDEVRYRVWRLLETSKDERRISRTLVDNIANLVRK